MCMCSEPLTPDLDILGNTSIVRIHVFSSILFWSYSLILWRNKPFRQPLKACLELNSHVIHLHMAISSRQITSKQRRSDLDATFLLYDKVRKLTKIMNRYNQVPHLTKDTIYESDKTQLDITNENQEVSPFPVGDHQAAMNRRKSLTNTRHK